MIELIPINVITKYTVLLRYIKLLWALALTMTHSYLWTRPLSHTHILQFPVKTHFLSLKTSRVPSLLPVVSFPPDFLVNDYLFLNAPCTSKDYSTYIDQAKFSLCNHYESLNFQSDYLTRL